MNERNMPLDMVASAHGSLIVVNEIGDRKVIKVGAGAVDMTAPCRNYVAKEQPKKVSVAPGGASILVTCD